MFDLIPKKYEIVFSAKSKVTTHAAAIINKHFSEAIHNKEAEIDAIEDSILEAQKALHLLRYGSVSRTYSNFKDMVNEMFVRCKNLSMRVKHLIIVILI